MNYQEWIKLYKYNDLIKENSTIIFSKILPIQHLNSIIKDYVIEPVFIQDLILFYPICVSIQEKITSLDCDRYFLNFIFLPSSGNKMYKCFSCNEILSPFMCSQHSILHDDEVCIQKFFPQKMYKDAMLKTKNKPQTGMFIAYNISIHEEHPNFYDFEWQNV